MSKANNNNSIVISYKNKLLLFSFDYPFQKNQWGFVGENADYAGSNSKTISKLLQEITKLKEPLQKMQVSGQAGDFFYFIKLSDNNVNSIVRNNGQKLEFYTIREIEKLNLTEETDRFLSIYKDQIATVLSE